jgi:hypothetical protein
MTDVYFHTVVLQYYGYVTRVIDRFELMGDSWRRDKMFEMWWHTVTHGLEKWRGNKNMEWVTSKRHMTAEHRLARAIQTLQSDVHSSPASSRLNWHPPPSPLTDLNGLVRLAERWKLVSAHMPSHFKRSLRLASNDYINPLNPELNPIC